MFLQNEYQVMISFYHHQQVPQTQDSIENFSNKISSAKMAQVTDDFMIIARVESLILCKSLKDAIKRAEHYSKAGADAIVIHSKKKTPNEILNFAKKLKKSF